jgi:catechol 2,3-dioxygenase-like lactoylglutathione lyase family enzyme
MIKGLNHINLAVCDLSISFDFYRDILGFKPLCRWPKGAYFLAGDLWFCLYEDPKAKPGIGYTHIAFSISTEDFSKMVDRLKKADVQLWKENSSEGDSLYFLDPDG